MNNYQDYQHPVTPIFRSHYSLGGLSILTLDEPGKAKPGGAASVFDFAKEAKLKEVTVVDDRIDGFVSGYRIASKIPDCKLIYGIRFTVVPDMSDKTIDSRRSESKVIVLIKGGYEKGYNRLVSLWNRAWGHEGHISYRLAGEDYSYGRLDWNLLKRFWDDEALTLALPFYGSFIERNTMTFAQLTPDLPTANPLVFRELDSGLPFEPLVGAAVDRYVTAQGWQSNVVPTKTVLYRGAEDAKAYVTFRAINAGGTFDEPRVSHLHSDRFSLESYLKLVIS